MKKLFFILPFIFFYFLSFTSHASAYKSLSINQVRLVPVFYNNSYSINNGGSGSGSLVDNTSLYPLFYKTSNTKTGIDYSSITTISWYSIDNRNSSPSFSNSSLRYWSDGTYTDIYNYILIPVGVYDSNNQSSFSFNFSSTSSGSSNHAFFLLQIDLNSNFSSGYYLFDLKIFLPTISMSSYYGVGTFYPSIAADNNIFGDVILSGPGFLLSGEGYCAGSPFFYFLCDIEFASSDNISINNSGWITNTSYSLNLYNPYDLSNSYLSDISSSLNNIFNSLNSANGSNNSLNNKNNQLSSSMSNYQRDTDTSKQYSNISDNIFVLDTSIFSSVSSTITLFSSCITSFFNSLGDLAVPLTLFLIVTFISCIIGIIKITNDSS